LTEAGAASPGKPARAGAASPGSDPLVRAVFVLLVIACLAAFLITQRLKHTPTAVQEFKLQTAFSPYPLGHGQTEAISFKLANADRVTVTIIDTKGNTVATLVRAYPVARYKQLSLRWNGRRGSARRIEHTLSPHGRTLLVPENPGRIAAPGEYRVRVSLRHRSLPVLSSRSFALVKPSTVATHAASASSLPGAGTLAAALLAALAAVLALAALMRRRADAFPLLAVLALPFRLPISADGRTVNLLIPLYLVVAAGTLVHLLPRLLVRIGLATGGTPRDGDADDAVDVGAGLSPTRPRSWASARGVGWLLFAAVALYALQAIYSGDRAKAAENLAFFYVPFALLFVILREVRWTRELLLRCLGVTVALAVLFAGVGFVEYARKSLFLNPKVVAANQYDNYFRVNSVFFDPSIYGRFLALVMIAVVAVVLSAGRSRREVLAGGAVLAWLLAGLVTSFSQSSIAALLLGVAVLGAWCWGVRPALCVAGALLALALALVALAPTSLHFGLKGSKGSASNATSGRTTLVTGGLELFAKRPLEGYGSGSFETEYKRRSSSDAENATSASHTIPVTIAAEQGVAGLAVYAALLVCAFLVLFRGAGRSSTRIALAACFAALVAHTWTYADFLEDPFTWALLAVGVALALAQEGCHGRGVQAGSV